LAALGRDEQAVASFSKTIDLKPMFAPAWISRGNAHERLGQWGKAIDDHGQVIKLAPKDPAAHNKLAWLLTTCPPPGLRDARRAVELAQKAVALDPKDADIRNTLGAAHYRAGEWQAALAALLKAVELRQGTGRMDSSDLFFLAMADWQNGKKDRARQWYDQACLWLAKHPHQPSDEDAGQRFRAEAAALLGVSAKTPLVASKAPLDRLAMFTLVLQTDPGAVWVLPRRGSILAERKEYQPAAADFARAAQASPDDPFLWYYHAMAKLGAEDLDGYRRVCAEMRGRFGKTSDRITAARVVFTCVVAPDGATAPAEMARLAERAVGYDRALASACYRDGQYEAAVRLYQEDSKRWSLRGVDLFFLAMAQHRLGQSANARESLARAAKWSDEAHRGIAGGSCAWYDQVELRCLRREAEALIVGAGEEQPASKE
jgi:tetratricopeptide (TPR) repeat protein